MLKDFVHQYQYKKEKTDLQEGKNEERAKQSSKFGSFLKGFLADILLFSAALVTMIIMLVLIYVVCGQSKLKTLVANIALQHAKGTEAADGKSQDIYCTCEMQWFIIVMLLIMLGLIYLVIHKIKKSSLCKGCLFSNITKVMLFTPNTQSYVPIKLCKIAGSIHFFKIRGG